MRIVGDWSHDALWGVVPYMHKSLEIFNDVDSKEVLMNGATWIYDHEVKEKYKHYERRCLLALWSPCEFTSTTGYYHFDHYDFFTEVYCICPFTCDFMNDHYGYEKFKYIPYPLRTLLLRSLEITTQIALGWGPFTVWTTFEPLKPCWSLIINF